MVKLSLKKVNTFFIYLYDIVIENFNNFDVNNAA